MTKRDVKKLDLRMRTIHQCFNEDWKALNELLDKLKGEHMRTESVDYVIECVKYHICQLHFDIAMLNQTMKVEMKECLYFLNKVCGENSEPKEVPQWDFDTILKEKQRMSCREIPETDSILS